MLFGLLVKILFCISGGRGLVLGLVVILVVDCVVWVLLVIEIFFNRLNSGIDRKWWKVISFFSVRVFEGWFEVWVW